MVTGRNHVPAHSPCKGGEPEIDCGERKETRRVDVDCFGPARFIGTTLHPEDGRIVSRVLLVEPDEDTREQHGQLLQHLGFEIVEALDARDALVKALTCHPAVVMTELHLPFFDGLALCELLRCDSTTRSVPILVVTTERNRAQLERARAAGADAGLVKPATLHALSDQMRHLLARSGDSHRTPATARPTPAAEHYQYAACTSLRFGPHPARVQSRAHLRFDTATPPDRPPSLVCPSCDRPLRYQRSHIGGVSARYPEQWDEFVCPAPVSCGIFEYRQRTRKLRRIVLPLSRPPTKHS